LTFFFPSSSKHNLLYYKAAKILGHLLGHALYQAILDTRISIAEVRTLFYQPLNSSYEALQLYQKWARRLDVFEYRESVKSERL